MAPPEKEGIDNIAFEPEKHATKNGLADLEKGRRVSGASPEVALQYSWQDINVIAEPPTGCCGRKDKKAVSKHILKNVSGICRPGELLAIMGASGAGKTTLLNVLTGRGGDNLKVTGNLHVNGEAIRPQSLTSRSAYVQQEDLFIGTLTVKEQLVFQARLRMDKHIPQSERMARVQEVMEELGLIKCQDTLIGIAGRIKGISGGETKRLAFACEMLTNPAMMFCDEPTTGLDSFMAQVIVESMREMARNNRTIISTIHQPSSEVFAIFDRVLLMAEGRVAFLGLSSDAMEFFGRSGRVCPENFNPADFYIATLAVHPDHEEESRAFINAICDDFDANEGQEVKRAVTDNTVTKAGSAGLFSQGEKPRSQYKASWFEQFSAVLKRSALEILREPSQMRIKIIQTLMIAALLGLIFLQQDNDQSGMKNINSVLFLCLTNMSFNNVFGVVNIFCTQVEIIRREHENGMYRTDVFFIAKNIAEIPLAVLQPVMFVAVIYYMVGLYPPAANFFFCMLIIVIVANVGVSFGYLISCMAKNLEMGLAISAPLIIPFMLFGGFFLNTDSVPVYYVWLQYLSWFSYANEALCINQWRDVPYIECDNSTASDLCLNSGPEVLDYLNFEESNFGIDFIALAALLVGFRLIGYIFLYIKFYRKKPE